MTDEKAVIVQERTGLLRPIASPAQLIERHKEVTALINEGLDKGVDYGIIPGTNGKNVLFKAGAERLCVAFGCHAEYRVVSSEADHDRENLYGRGASKQTSIGFYRYIIACDIIRDGTVKGSGIGGCSSMESKYITRPRDVENTILKMAQKRALVAAVLNTFALSDRFTQDIEEEIPEKKEGVYLGSPEEEIGLIDYLETAYPNIKKSRFTDIHKALIGKQKHEIANIIKDLKL